LLTCRTNRPAKYPATAAGAEVTAVTRKRDNAPALPEKSTARPKCSKDKLSIAAQSPATRAMESASTQPCIEGLEKNIDAPVAGAIQTNHESHSVLGKVIRSTAYSAYVTTTINAARSQFLGMLLTWHTKVWGFCWGGRVPGFSRLRPRIYGVVRPLGRRHPKTTIPHRLFCAVAAIEAREVVTGLLAILHLALHA
jgi:hypothetical protein